MPDFVIRDAVAADAGEICDIRIQIVRDPVITFTTDEPTPAQIAQDIAQAAENGAAYLVATRDDAVIGYAYWTQFRSGPGYRYTIEHSVHLAQNARGSGVGCALMQELMERATASGMKVMVAGVSGGNRAGEDFHKGLGFQKTGVMPGVGFKNGQLFDLILMQRKLS